MLIASLYRNQKHVSSGLVLAYLPLEGTQYVSRCMFDCLRKGL